MANSNKKRVAVVVLGDIGRSPRMQYHALSLADADFKVNLFGYVTTKPLQNLTSHSNVHINKLKQYPEPNIPKLLNYFFKTFWQTVTLLFSLSFNRCDYLICQNPPAVPTLFVCWLYCLLFNVKFIIDWHNYAHTILGFNIGLSHPLVKITKWVETTFGRKAAGNLCVTKAMNADLEKQWGIIATTLYDRPPTRFKPITVEDKHNIFSRLSSEYPEFESKNGDEFQTVFTEIVGNSAQLKSDRPAMLISSTSWTEDEDFNILLNALIAYDQSNKNLPTLICVITGKGPMKKRYLKKISNLKLNKVNIVTPWLEPNDYPVLLASADLGVCLHTSTSGLDLPMKVVDMFGCGLPVCAYKFHAIDELVQHGKNGFVFSNADALSAQIQDWFDGFPNSEKYLKKEQQFKGEIAKFRELRWQENWELHALPLFQNK